MSSEQSTASASTQDQTETVVVSEAEREADKTLTVDEVRGARTGTNLGSILKWSTIGAAVFLLGMFLVVVLL